MQIGRSTNMVLTSAHRIAAASPLAGGLFCGRGLPLATAVRDGIRAAFAEANRDGGVQGRELVLDSRDDGYEPNNTIAATTQILGNIVFELIGSVGTPTTNAILPLLAESGVPLIGPFTGSEGLRNPRNP